MPETISRPIKLDALALVAAGHTRDHVSHLMHISEPTIARAKRKQRLHGDIEGAKKKIGRREKFASEIINVPHSLSSFRADQFNRWPYK
jgi:Helix-turn-helix domain